MQAHTHSFTYKRRMSRASRLAFPCLSQLFEPKKISHPTYQPERHIRRHDHAYGNSLPMQESAVAGARLNGMAKSVA